MDNIPEYVNKNVKHFVNRKGKNNGKNNNSIQNDFEKNYRENRNLVLQRTGIDNQKVKNSKELDNSSFSNEKIQGLEKYSKDEIKFISKDYIKEKLNEN